MRDFSVVSTGVLLKAQSECILAPIGLLLGLETVADCMNDPSVRHYFGMTLRHEIMPQLPERERDEAVIQACRYLSFRPASLSCAALTDGLIGSWRQHILPLLKKGQRGLPLALAALVMLLCGVRAQGQEYRLPGELLAEPLTLDTDAMRAFSRLSWDMQADSLAYAVLADREIWQRDLREEPGLTDSLSEALESIQLSGIRGAIERCWE